MESKQMELTKQITDLVAALEAEGKVVIILPVIQQKLVMGSVHEGPEPDARIETAGDGTARLHLRLPRGRDSVVPGPKGEPGDVGEPGRDGRAGRDNALTEAEKQEFEASLEARLRILWTQDVQAAIAVHDLEKSVADSVAEMVKRTKV